MKPTDTRSPEIVIKHLHEKVERLRGKVALLRQERSEVLSSASKNQWSSSKISFITKAYARTIASNERLIAGLRKKVKRLEESQAVKE
jgi:hypothetical protein